MKPNTFKRIALFLENRSIKVDLILTSVLAVFVASVFYHQMARVGESRRWVVHSYEVRDQINSIYTTVKEIEAAQRGYLLTGNPVFLSPWNVDAHSKADLT